MLCIVVITLVPILNIAPELQTFMHPWRPELAASIALIGFAFWAARSDAFRAFLGETGAAERYLILLPITLFIAWSGLSALWANSWTSVLHHTTVWISYLAFYLLFRFFSSTAEGAAKLTLTAACALWIIALPAVVEYAGFIGGEHMTNISMRYSKYAELANTVAPVIFATGLLARRRLRLLGFATMALICLFVFATQSRAGIGLFVLSSAALVTSVLIIPRLRIHLRPALALAVVLISAAAVTTFIFTNSKGEAPIAARLANPETAQSTNVRPFLAAIAGLMFRNNVARGVGADNFGLEFDEYRREFALQNPDSGYLSIAEDQIAERAHNEYAQILAELGVVGIGIFCVLLAGIAYLVFGVWKQRESIDIVSFAALIGLGAFFASSFVSSYSFRLFQNGFIFFLALAIAFRVHKTGGEAPKKGVVRLAALIVIASSIALGTYCILRVAAVQTMIASGQLETLDEKERSWTSALSLDPENAYFYSYIGQEHLKQKNFSRAAPYLRACINRGRATVMDYSYLATAQRLQGDLVSAAQTLQEGIELYPRSVFLRSRLGVLLNDLGDSSAAFEQFAIANSIDASQAKAWRMYIESGGVAVSKAAVYGEVIDVMTLWPKNAIYAVQTERELRFPDEKYPGG
jgi:O-antigen ligase